MSRFADRGPRFVGTITLAVAMALVGALFVPSGFALGTQTYAALLSQAGGLRSGNEVRVAGVPVGDVKSVDLDGGHVKVEFRIGKSVKLGPDTRAEVKVATLLGNHFLDLRPAGEGTLPGRTIPLANTRVPFAIQDIVEAGGTALEKLDGKKLRDALRVLSDNFRDTPKVTGQALDAVARLSDVIVSRKADLNKLIASTNLVASNLDANGDVLIDLMRQASLILEEVVRRRDAIAELLADSQTLAVQLTGLVRDNRKVLRPLLANLNVVLGTLRENKQALDQIAILLGPAARYFANATGNGPYVDVNGPNAIFPDNVLCVPQQKCVPGGTP
ncbi:MAG: MCE family protein [Sporichthyaceae bacterium]